MVPMLLNMVSQTQTPSKQNNYRILLYIKGDPPNLWRVFFMRRFWGLSNQYDRLGVCVPHLIPRGRCF